MIKIIFIILTFFTSFNVSANTIAAVVNNQLILMSDLNNRINLLAALSSGNTELNSKEARIQAISALIDEALISEQAKNVNLVISDAEIQEKIALLEKNNNMPEGYLPQFFAHKHVSFELFKTYLKNQLMQQQLLAGGIASKSVTTRNEVERAINATQDSINVSVKIFSLNKTQANAAITLNKIKNKLTATTKDVTPLLKNTGIKVQNIEQNITKFDKISQTIIRDLSVNQISDVVQHEDNFIMIMLCKSNVSELGEKYSNALSQFINQSKASNKIQKYLNNLRNQSYIKVYVNN